MKMKKIAICNQKGGVGKTTTTINLGQALVNLGYKVLLVDSDPQLSMTMALGNPGEVNLTTLFQNMVDGIEACDLPVKDAILHHSEGLDYISTDEGLNQVQEVIATRLNREYFLDDLLNEIDEPYDFCLIDCRPTIDILPINALATANSVIIPVQTKKMGMEGLELLLQSIRGIQRRINRTLKIEGILYTLTTNDNESKSIKRYIKNTYTNIRVFDSEIPTTTNLSKPFIEKHTAFSIKNNRGAEAYLEFAKELVGGI